MTITFQSFPWALLTVLFSMSFGLGMVIDSCVSDKTEKKDI